MRLPVGTVRRTLIRLLSKDVWCTFLWPQTSRLSFDLAIACGGPNIIPEVAGKPMMKLMFHHMLGAFHYRGVPVIDAAVGSCYPLEHVPEIITDPLDRAYFVRQHRFLAASTVRDTLAKTLWEELGFHPEIIPCAAIVSGAFFERVAEGVKRDQYILVNFQERGANSDWQQHVDPVVWRSTVQQVIETLKRDHAVHMLCHNEKERELARGFGVPVHLPTTPEEYGKIIAGAKVAFVSRLHAAIPLAGIGVPSLVAGTDSRLRAVEFMGLPTVFAKNADSEAILKKIYRLVEIRSGERQRLITLRERTADDYCAVIRRVVGR
ncbi:MAG: hypothetical protein PHZ00_01655 [Candidatus Peribacteraceae bacterium]|nr:hypothetical protein [Candidatus Peribacteraceae bacterium]